jgi:hypothetical protein
MRIIVSIILNGMENLLHNDFYKKVPTMCDYWIIAEGASKSQGSTSWCKQMPEGTHINGRSSDGTYEFLKKLSEENSKVILLTKEGMWESKDEQHGSTIEKAKEFTNECFLWHMCVDEQWEEAQLDEAEKMLLDLGVRHGKFSCNCFVGKNLLAVGAWGEGRGGGYPRLWHWKGESLRTHEPETFHGDWPAVYLPQKFNHYNYYFENDVKFKDAWYSGHEGIYERWLRLNSIPKEMFPVHISELITGGWGRTDTQIIYVEDK